MNLTFTLTNENNDELNAYVIQKVREHKYQTGRGYFAEDGSIVGFEDLNIYLNDEEDNLIGALLGSTHFNALHVSWLWVADEYRHRGYAREMLNRAIVEAQDRGCTFAYGDTWEIQGAYTLYDKLGAKIIMRIEDFPPGSALTRYRFDFADWIDNGTG